MCMYRRLDTHPDLLPQPATCSLQIHYPILQVSAVLDSVVLTSHISPSLLSLLIVAHPLGLLW